MPFLSYRIRLLFIRVLERPRVMVHSMAVLISKKDLPSSQPFSSPNRGKFVTCLWRVFDALLLRLVFRRDNLLDFALVFAAPDLGEDGVAYLDGLVVLVFDFG